MPTERDVYHGELLKLGHGLPIYEPDPAGKYDKVRVGDVGYVDRFGCFHRAFNVFLPKNNDINCQHGTPDDFVPLSGRSSETQHRTALPAGAMLSTHVRILEGSLVVSGTCIPANASITFSTSNEQGAALVIKYNAYREDLLQERDVMGREIVVSDIVLVTGCDLTADWATAVFVEKSTRSEIEFKVCDPASVISGSIGFWGTWQSSLSIPHRCGPHPVQPPTTLHASRAISHTTSNTTEPNYNQCIFLRGFRVRERRLFLPKVIKAAAEPEDLQNNRDNDIVPSVCLVEDGTDSNEDGTNEICDTSHNGHLYNPNSIYNTVFDYILDETGADIAIIHDNDVSQIVKHLDGKNIRDILSRMLHQDIICVESNFENDLQLKVGHIKTKDASTPMHNAGDEQTEQPCLNPQLHALLDPSVSGSDRTDGETLECMRANAQLIARTIANLAEATNVPYLKGLAGLSSLIFDYADGVAVNKEYCSRIFDNITQLLVEIEERTVEAGGKRSEALEDQASQLKTSLEVILQHVKRLSDQNRSYFRRFILMERDKEIIQKCDEELNFAMNMFSLQSSIEIQTCIPSMLRVLEDIEDRLRRIERQSAGRKRLDSHGLLHEHHDKDKQSQETFKDVYYGSNLRPAPAIFCGRSDVLEELVRHVSHPTAARIAILGPGGIGKTSLALKLLHHEDVVRRYAANRFFVPCDSAVSAESIVFLIASNIHFPAQWASNTVRSDQTEAEVLAHLRGSTSDSHAKDGSQTPTILVLDNFESPWERNRTEVEQLLARLAALENVTLVITLRGAERPSQVKWDQPMLPPLQTLDPQPARDMFLSISDASFPVKLNESELDELDELLTLCDYLPLAIQLMAGLAGPGMDTVPGLVRRWKGAKRSTAMLSNSKDSNHSLEISIELSLASPRMKRVPEAHTLLALLAMLPDGIRDDDLEIAMPIFEDLEKCRLALLKTLLAYRDEASGRLKMLAPIRAYVTSCENNFPRANLVKSLEDYFWTFIQHAGTDQNNEDKVKRALPELGNIESLVDRAFSKDIHLDSAAASAVKLAQFILQASLGKPCLTQLQRALGICRRRQNKKLEADCSYTMTLYKRFFPDVGTDTAGDDILNVLSLYEDLGDKIGQGHCHHQLGCLYHSTRKLERSRASFEKAFQCHLEAGCLHGQAYALLSLARVLHIMNEIGPALQRANDSLQILRTKCHVPTLEVQCFEFLGYIHFQNLCKYVTAAELFEESLRIYKALSLEESANCTNTTVSAGELAYVRSQYDDAKDAFQRAAVIYRRTKRRDREAYSLIKLGLAYIGLNSVDDAFTSIHAGLDIWEELRITWGIGVSYLALGDLACHRGAHSDAEEHYTKALQSFRADSMHWKASEADALLKLGILFIRTDREGRARDSIENASRLYKEAVSRRGETDCLRQLAELDLRQCDGTRKRDVLTRLESVEKDYCDMGLYVERQECALVIARAKNSRHQSSYDQSHTRQLCGISSLPYLADKPIDMYYCTIVR